MSHFKLRLRLKMSTERLSLPRERKLSVQKKKLFFNKNIASIDWEWEEDIVSWSTFAIN